MKTRKVLAVTSLGIALAFLSTPRADAGCGCTKPPPAAASVRPNFTWAGQPVSLFHERLVLGAPYRVLFTSGTVDGDGIVDATATEQRDLADGKSKPVLTVDLPNLPLGPTRIEVLDADGDTVLIVGDETFTVLQLPVVIPADLAKMHSGHQAAVGRDNTLYFAFDLSNISAAMSFEAVAKNYPLRFDLLDVVIYNTQGILMQLLDEQIPGWIMFEETSKKNSNQSNRLEYYRHEFETYWLEHEERAIHAVDPENANWHLDGTPHVDHNHLVLAIRGTLSDGALPEPGATPEFTLRVTPKAGHGTGSKSGLEPASQSNRK